MSGQRILMLLQSLAPTAAETATTWSFCFGKADLKWHFFEREFQLNSLQFCSALQCFWHCNAESTFIRVLPI
jgi:hypothetical protein